MKKYLITLIITILTAINVTAQYYESGQDPASLKWRQINTEHFRVVFPEDFLSGAQKYARFLEMSFDTLSVLYPGVNARLPVVIHNHSMESNGFVFWAPRRMELFPLPGQVNLPGSPEWQLSVHETVHMLQLYSLNQRGFGLVMKYLVGEQAMGLDILTIPMWAIEGDAVYAETATGLSGRGSSNSFTQGARALATNHGGIYGYDKMIGESYKDFTPNYYVFGYLMMNHLRSIDSSAWNNTFRDVLYRIPLNPVNRGLKRETGLTKKKLYESTFALLEKEWKESDSHGFTEYPALNVSRSRDYVNHYSPFRAGDGLIISLRTSLSDPSRFVMTDEKSGREHVLTTTGYIYPYIFSYADSTLVWSEIVSDIRWDNRDYSVIRKMDLRDGTVNQVTYRTRYEAPDLSPDGRTIVAVSSTSDLRCSLVFLDASTGEVLMDVLPPDNLIFQRPAWSSDGRAVTVVTLSDEGEGIRTYRPTGKKWTVNMAEGNTDIIQAEMFNDTLFYLAQGDGSDNIYRITGDTVITRVTRSRYGISGFSITGDEIMFSDYTAGGFIIAAEPSSANYGRPSGSMHGVIPELAPWPSGSLQGKIPGRAPSLSGSLQGETPELARSFSGSATGDRQDYTVPESTPYRKFSHLFNFHSWLPFYADIDELMTDPTIISPGVTLMSQNLLSTLVTTTGYEYSQGNHYLHTGIKWKGWHPIIEADLRYGGEQIVSKDTVTRPDPPSVIGDLSLNASIYDQLWFAQGKFRQLLMPIFNFSFNNRYTYMPQDNRYDRNLIFLTGRLYFSNTFRMAYRDINPRWGQVIDLRYTGAPWDIDLYGARKYARGILFFPGVAHNHSLAIRAGYEDQTPIKRLILNNTISRPRGYDNSLISEKLVSVSADYTMPLFYPDLAAGSLLYLKRIRGSLFYDRMKGWGTHDYNAHEYAAQGVSFSSMGAELLADFFLLRIPFEISAGASAGYTPDEDRFFVRGVFSVNIYGTVLGRER